AYRTTSTAALQVILGIPHLHLQLQREARATALFRRSLPFSTNGSNIYPSEIEDKTTGWSAHPSEHLSPTEISLNDGSNINTGLRIYTVGLKTEKGVCAAFCVFTDVNITHRWSTRLFLRNTVFQAEILALLKAVEHAVFLPNQELNILVDNQVSIKSAANPESHNSNARKIFKLLHSQPNIRVSWIKAHAGYIENEEADRQAKKAAETENFPETPIEFPKSFIKAFIRQKMLATWEMASDDGDTGRLIHNIIPKHRQEAYIDFCPNQPVVAPNICQYDANAVPFATLDYHRRPPQTVVGGVMPHPQEVEDERRTLPRGRSGMHNPNFHGSREVYTPPRGRRTTISTPV
ncbi:hypothetical protein AVEN_62908-1, partial [Araneus ventricosus]